MEANKTAEDIERQVNKTPMPTWIKHYSEQKEYGAPTGITIENAMNDWANQQTSTLQKELDETKQKLQESEGLLQKYKFEDDVIQFLDKKNKSTTEDDCN